MKKNFYMLISIVLFYNVAVFAQWAITDASWPTTVDQDGDGYTRSRTLRITFSASEVALVKFKIYVDYNIYYTTPDWTPINGPAYVDIPGIGTSSTGGEMSHATYDFYIEMVNTAGTILANKDQYNDVDLQNEKFELASEDITTSYSDLVVQNLEVPTTAIAGSEINIGCRVLNQGAGDAGSSKVGYYLSPNSNGTTTFLDDDGVSALTANGDYDDEDQLVTIPPETSPGTYYITFYADYENVVNEGTINENNNKSSKQITITAPMGNLSVTVKNIDGTGTPLPGSNGIVQLYNSSGQKVGNDQPTNSSGTATFSNVAAGSGYYIRVYHTPNNPTTIFGQEYWGTTTGITITAGQTTSVTHNRNMPYQLQVNVYDPNGNDVTGKTVPAGTKLTFKVTVKNPNNSSKTVKARLVVDRSKTESYDYDNTSSAVTVPGNNGTQVITLTDYTPTTQGNYYGAVGVQTSDNSAYLYTDGGPWGSTPLIIIGPSSGNLTVAVKNITGTGSPLPGANGIVQLFNSSGQKVGNDQPTNGEGIATFSNVAAGTGYKVRVYHTPNNPTTIFGQEYWGETTGITITAGQTASVTHNRNMPYQILTKVYDPNGNDVTGLTVAANTKVTFKVTVKNPNTSSKTVKARLVVDRSKTEAYDYDNTSSTVIVPGNNGTQVITLTDYTPTMQGNYYGAVGVQTSDNSTYLYTDGGPWGSTPLIIIGPSSGNLTVAVKNIDGTGTPLPGSNGIVQLYNSGGQKVGNDQPTNSSGTATFSNVAAGSGYYVRVYHTPNNPTTIFGQEYWGTTTGITITAGQTTSITHNRNMPYQLQINVYDPNGNDVTGKTVPAGTKLTFKVTVKNPNTSSKTVKARLVVDRSKTESYDYDNTSSSVTVPGNNGTQVITLTDYTPTMQGNYYGAVGVQTSDNSTYLYTDGGPWGSTQLIGVIEDQSCYQENWIRITDANNTTYQLSITSKVQHQESLNRYLKSNPEMPSSDALTVKALYSQETSNSFYPIDLVERLAFLAQSSKKYVDEVNIQELREAINPSHIIYDREEPWAGKAYDAWTPEYISAWWKEAFVFGIVNYGGLDWEATRKKRYKEIIKYAILQPYIADELESREALINSVNGWFSKLALNEGMEAIINKVQLNQLLTKNEITTLFNEFINTVKNPKLKFRLTKTTVMLQGIGVLIQTTGDVVKWLALQALAGEEAENRLEAIARWSTSTNSIDPIIQQAVNEYKIEFFDDLNNKWTQAAKQALSSFATNVTKAALNTAISGVAISIWGGPGAWAVWGATMLGEHIYDVLIEPAQLATISATLQQAIYKSEKWQELINDLSPQSIFLADAQDLVSLINVNFYLSWLFYDYYHKMLTNVFLPTYGDVQGWFLGDPELYSNYVNAIQDKRNENLLIWSKTNNPYYLATTAYPLNDLTANNYPEAIFFQNISTDSYNKIYCLANLIADFNVSPLQGFVNQTEFLFTNTSSSSGGNIISWEWDFGDGTPKVNNPSASHIYSIPGNFNVKLTVLNGIEMNTVNKSIIVRNAQPIANFNTNITNGTAPFTVNFDNLSQNSNSYLWSFGDGQNSTEESPTHIFTQPGTYSISLSAMGPGGQDVESKVNYISVLGPKGNLLVNTNLDSSTYKITGPKTLTGGGFTKSFSNIPIGQYQIIFNSAGIFAPPPAQSFEILLNQTTVITANYNKTMPILSWTGGSGYESDGVNPNEGNLSTSFTFKIKYSDADGDAPQSGYPKLHIKKAGFEIANSPFLMSEANTNPFTSGRIYSFEKNNLEVGTDYTYYFEAYDANGNPAAGAATVEQSGPMVSYPSGEWIKQSSGTTQRLRQIKAVDNNVVWICGAGGVVLKTEDGGTTWNIKTLTDAAFTNYSMDALNSTTAWVTGTNTAAQIDFKIWKTTDGGNTWQQQYQNIKGFGNGIRFFDANNGICYADPDPFPSANWEILTTSNGGATWNRVPSSNYPAADFVNQETGIAGSIDNMGDTVWFTTRSGVTGTPNRVYKSLDRGLNWTVSSFNSISNASNWSCIAFRNEMYGLVFTLDGTLARTTDGGESWSTSDVSPKSYRFVTNVLGKNLYLGVGSSGLANYSDNDGLTWTPMTTGTTNNLYAVDATTKYAWAAGDSGTILKCAVPTIISIEDWFSSEIPSKFNLYQNYPNPFNPTTTITFSIPRESNVNLTVFNALGEEITKLVDEYKSVGHYSVEFITNNLPSGIYFYKIKAEDFVEVKKMILLR